MSTVFLFTLLISTTTALNVPFVSSATKISPKFIEEAEIKHGRVAMVSSLIIPTLELFNHDMKGIDVLASQDFNVQATVFSVIGVSEACQLFNSYESPMNPSKWFLIKDSHVPGDYNFDPLNLTVTKETYTSNREFELLNGRVAMLGAFGALCQEFFTDTKITDNLHF
tara:strand:- start:98 stop:601 length:504 start_codon:yes stop_codon:yes gene_type:complete